MTIAPADPRLAGLVAEHGTGCEDDRDGFRVAHDVDAVRTRFEKQPFWPASGAVGERR